MVGREGTPLAAACCRGSCWRDLGGRSHASACSSPSSHSWTSPSRTLPSFSFTPEQLLLRVGLHHLDVLHTSSSWDSVTPMTECHAQEKVTSDFLHGSRSNARTSECCMEDILNSQSCACRELTGRVIIATVTRHRMCAHTFVRCRWEDLSCLPQHAAEVDLEGRVQQTWLIHRTQIWTLIRPRSPPMEEKDFPRGSAMTVLWVSICRNGVEFLFHFRMSSKHPQGTAI